MFDLLYFLFIGILVGYLAERLDFKKLFYIILFGLSLIVIVSFIDSQVTIQGISSSSLSEFIVFSITYSYGGIIGFYYGYKTDDGETKNRWNTFFKTLEIKEC